MYESKFRTVSLMILLSSICVGGLSFGQEVTEEKGGFSYTPPEGWESMEFPGNEFRFTYGPADDGFSPNLNIIRGKRAAMSLGFNARLGLATQKKNHPEFKLIKIFSVLTADAQPAVVAIIEHNESGKLLRFTQVYLDGIGDERFLLTYTAFPGPSKEIDPEILKSISSFKLLSDREPPIDLRK